MNKFIKISVTNIKYEDSETAPAPKNLVLLVDRAWYNQSPKSCVIDAIWDSTGYNAVKFDSSPL